MSEHLRDRQSFTASVAALFREWPNTWIHSDELARRGGKNGWRTRVSNCRQLYGMTIENKVVRDAKGVATSFYRYRPASLLELAS